LINKLIIFFNLKQGSNTKLGGIASFNYESYKLKTQQNHRCHRPINIGRSEA